MSTSPTPHTVTYTKYGATLKCTLYGDVTPQQLDEAKAVLAARIEQLHGTPAAPVEAPRRRPSSRNDWDDEFDDE